MILLQFTQDTANIDQHAASNEVYFYIEITILTVVIIYQLYHSSIVYLNIKELRNIFSYRLFMRNGLIEKYKLHQIEEDSPDILFESDLEQGTIDDLVDESVIKISLVDTKGINTTINRIKNTINAYLINNYGAVVNFSIIKDIIDREVDVQDGEISSTITTPLYLGLAATMIGIIFGLWSMPIFKGAEFSVEAMNPLIRGVKWAMIASFTGLGCTIILSSFVYKTALRKVLNEKNEQLSYLQAKLLPELLKAEDTGVAGLKASLDRFARVATIISDNVLIAANQTGENLVLQQEVIDKVEKIGMLRVSKTNLELFDRLEKNMHAFSEFSNYIVRMESIASNLSNFASRTSAVEKIIQEIDTNLRHSKELTRFLNEHFDKIESAGDQANKAVGIAEAHFEDAITKLRTRTDEVINLLYKNAGIHELQLTEIYATLEQSVKAITSNYIKELTNVYSNSTPKFDQLDNLALIPAIKDELILKTNDFQNHANINAQRLIDSVNELNYSLKQLDNKLNHQPIIDKITSIEERLKHKENKALKVPEKTVPKAKPQDPVGPEPIGIGKLFSNLLRGKRDDQK